MQRKKILTILIAGAMVFALAAMAMAQATSTAGSKTNVSSYSKKETTAVKPTNMTSQANKEMMGAKREMAEESSADDWGRIVAHYNEMMQMTDTAMLKMELAKHQEMMVAYRSQMMATMETTHKNKTSEHPAVAKGENAKVMGGAKVKTAPATH